MVAHTASEAPIPIAGGWSNGGGTHLVHSPYDRRLVGAVATAADQDIQAALDGASSATRPLAGLTAWERSERLLAIADALATQTEEFASLISAEAGKPIREARAEALRASYVFRWAGEEAKRQNGSWIPLDTEPGLGRRAGIVRRVPVGPLLAITPFNFPLSLVAHKVAPALAAGNPVLLKPSTRTPLTALKLSRVILEQDWPIGALSLLIISNELTELVASAPGVKAISFTGSDAVGWRLKSANPRKHITLELGGNAPVVVASDADVDHAIARLVPGAFAYAGQVCISTQRILVAEPLYDRFVDLFSAAASRLVLGDPSLESTEVGPLITQEAAARVESWIGEAVQAGATLAAGGVRADGMVTPAVLIDLPRDTRCWRNEIFGPAVSITPYRSFEQAIELANDSSLGLQAAIFTQRMDDILAAHALIEAGALIVNESPFFRAVQMPYGGVKDSGWGREGVTSAIQELTEERLLVVPLPETN